MRDLCPVLCMVCPDAPNSPPIVDTMVMPVPGKTSRPIPSGSTDNTTASDAADGAAIVALEAEQYSKEELLLRLV